MAGLCPFGSQRHIGFLPSIKGIFTHIFKFIIYISCKERSLGAQITLGYQTAFARQIRTFPTPGSPTTTTFRWFTIPIRYREWYCVEFRCDFCCVNRSTTWWLERNQLDLFLDSMTIDHPTHFREF